LIESNISRFIRQLGFAAFVLSLLMVHGCYKVENTTATIRVIDLDEIPVQGASVFVYPDTTGTTNGDVMVNESLVSTKITDAEGEVFLDFTSYFKDGQVGLFVLNVEVTYSNTDTSLMVPSLLKVDEQTHNKKVVSLPILK
jgi:hypothetical protein